MQWFINTNNIEQNPITKHCFSGISQNPATKVWKKCFINQNKPKPLFSDIFLQSLFHCAFSPLSFCVGSLPSLTITLVSLVRWRHTTLTSWTTTAGYGCRSACSWWRRQIESRGRSRQSTGPSCSSTVTLISSVTSEAPSWCMTEFQVLTRSLRWVWFCLSTNHNSLPTTEIKRVITLLLV